MSSFITHTFCWVAVLIGLLTITTCHVHGFEKESSLPFERALVTINIELDLANNSCIPCLSRIMYVNGRSYGRMAAQVHITVAVRSAKALSELDSMRLDTSIYTVRRTSRATKGSRARVGWASNEGGQRIFKLPTEETSLINFVDSLALSLDMVALDDGMPRHIDDIELPAKTNPVLLDWSQPSCRLLFTAPSGDRFVVRPGTSNAFRIPYASLVPDSLQQRLMTWIETRFVDDSTMWCMYTTSDSYIDTVINGEAARLYNTHSTWRSEVALGTHEVKSIAHKRTRSEEVAFHIWSSDLSRRIVIPSIKEGSTAPLTHFNIVYMDTSAHHVDVLAEKVPVEYYPQQFQKTTNVRDTIILGGPNCKWMKVYPKNRSVRLKALFNDQSGNQIASIQTIGHLLLVSYTLGDRRIGACLMNTNGIRQSPFYVYEGAGRIVATVDGETIRLFIVISRDKDTLIAHRRTLSLRP